MAYHVVWHHVVAQGRILAHFLALRLFLVCTVNIVQTNTYDDARVPDTIEMAWVVHVR